jgi:hypothetical protein
MNKTTSPIPDGAEPVAVILEPLPGHEDEEIVASLEEAGVNDITILAPGYISAHAMPEALKAVEEIADIHVKPRKQPRASAKRSEANKSV